MPDGASRPNKRIVYIAMLSYTGTPEMQTLHAIRDATEDAEKAGIAVIFDRIVRNSLIADARNSMVARFLAHPDKPTDLFFWDDDTEPERGAFVNLVLKNVDFALGIYRTKTEEVYYPIDWSIRGPDAPLETDPETRLLEIKMAAMGWCCLSRKGIETMCRAYPRTYMQFQLQQRAPLLFDCGVLEGEDFYGGEDNWYCDRWRRIGGQIWVDPEITMRHWGWKDPLNPQLGKDSHEGHFGNYLRNRPGSGVMDCHVDKAKAILKEQGIAIEVVPEARGNGVPEARKEVVPPAPANELDVAISGLVKVASLVETRIAVCIPTRGKPAYLERFLEMSASNCVLKNTQFVIAMDHDDTDAVLYRIDKTYGRTRISVADREDSLGAKYNRCTHLVPDVDLYVMGLDDVGIATKGWDAMLASAAAKAPHGVGAFHFGAEPHGEYLPSFIAWTKKVCELADGFCPEIFPFWWNNTWNYEIAELAGIITELPLIKSAYPETFPAPARTDILYWARVFDELRPVRVGIAKRVYAAVHPDWSSRADGEPEGWVDILVEQEHRNSKLRDPAFCKRLERDMSLPETDLARHVRLKARAELMLPGIASRVMAGMKAEVGAYVDR